jgi:hypothetical protein
MHFGLLITGPTGKTEDHSQHSTGPAGKRIGDTALRICGIPCVYLSILLGVAFDLVGEVAYC